MHLKDLLHSTMFRTPDVTQQSVGKTKYVITRQAFARLLTSSMMIEVQTFMSDCAQGAPAHADEHAPRLGEGLHAALRGEHQREGEANRAQQHADGHQALRYQPAAQAVQRQQRRMHRAPAAHRAQLLRQ